MDYRDQTNFSPYNGVILYFEDCHPATLTFVYCMRPPIRLKLFSFFNAPIFFKLHIIISSSSRVSFYWKTFLWWFYCWKMSDSPLCSLHANSSSAVHIQTLNAYQRDILRRTNYLFKKRSIFWNCEMFFSHEKRNTTEASF